MKRFLVITLLAVFSCGALFAQGEMDAYKLSKREVTGTARSMSMGGAFGALGGDISGIAINPAGIGIYQRSEIVTTLDVQGTSSKSTMGNLSVSKGQTKASFDNLAFVTTFSIPSDLAPRINVGFSYNKLANFNRRLSSKGNNLQNSLTHYMAGRANGYDPNDLGLNDDQGYRMDVWDNADWLSVFGYNSGLIGYMGDKGNNYISSSRFSNNHQQGLGVDNNYILQENGGINSYDFNIGTTFGDFLSVGFTLSLTDIDYTMQSTYSEDFIDPGFEGSGFDLTNYLRTEGSGTQVRVGVIVKPIQQLHIGLSYQSPTWYHMSDYYAADLNHDLRSIANDNRTILNQMKYSSPGAVNSYGGDQDGRTNYHFRTPDKWTLSAAEAIGDMGVISVDYELTGYGSMNLSDPDGNAYGTNNDIKADFRNASAIRVGGEYRVTPRFSVRAGFNWMQSPMKANVRNDVAIGKTEIITAGSDTHFMLDGATYGYSAGLGYRFSHHFYTDFAFVVKTYTSDLYTFAWADKTTVSTNRYNGILTFGYKF